MTAKFHFDYATYRYDKFQNRPNVLLAVPVGNPDAAQQMQSVVLATAQRMFAVAPKNTYVFFPRANGEERLWFTRCSVVRDGVTLGTLSAAQGRSGASVCVDNTAIRESRERGGGMITSDPKRGAALALKMFRPVPTENTALMRAETLRQKLYLLERGSNSEKDAGLGVLRTLMGAELEREWDTRGMALLAPFNLPADRVEQFARRMETFKSHNSLRVASTDSKLTAIYVDNGTMHCMALSLGNNVNTKSRRAIIPEDMVPAELRAKVGMLKLVPDGNYIPDVGYHDGDGAYVVFFDLHAFTAGVGGAADEDGDDTDD